MEIAIINYTKKAKELLIFSKKTRLNMSPETYDSICDLTEKEKIKELNYIFSTIKSSLEFVDYTIMITGVSRAFTHQLVRHRVGISFAQQSQRVTNMKDFDYIIPTEVKNSLEYKKAMAATNESYKELLNLGIKPESARGILPTNITTNILMKINLRSLSDMMSQRLCNRAQEEFRLVMESIKREVMMLHPWTEEILQCYCDINKKCFFKNKKGCGKYGE